MNNLIIDGKPFKYPEIPELAIDTGRRIGAGVLVGTINPTISADAEMSFECESILNPNAMRKLLGLDLAHGPDISASLSFTGEGIKQVQIKKHRKKRINKKWAKRYGYKSVLTNVKIIDASLAQCNGPCEDGYTFEFVGRVDG